MTWFTVKKTLFDGWDAFLGLVALNIGFIAIAIAFALPAFALGPGLPSALLMALGFLAFETNRAAVSVALVPVAASASGIRLRDWLEAWPKAIPTGLLLGGVELLLSLAVRAAVPFYLGMGSMLGALGLGVVLWTAAAVLLGLQWLPAARALMPQRGLKASLRVAFAMLFDNLGFSLFVGLWNLVGMALSFFLAFLVPGFAGAALARVEALRLRLYKYEWLEKQAEPKRAKVPWKELLADDAERLGPRTLRNFIFPWKD